MSGPESLMRRTVLRALNPQLHAVPIEDGCNPGTPDIAYTRGWIELKYLAAFPSKPDAIVKVPHFTLAQRRWHQAHSAAAGRCWVLLKVGDKRDAEWFLFYGADAAECLGIDWTRENLTAYAVWTTRGFTEEDGANLFGVLFSYK